MVELAGEPKGLPSPLRLRKTNKRKTTKCYRKTQDSTSLQLDPIPLSRNLDNSIISLPSRPGVT